VDKTACIAGLHTDLRRLRQANADLGTDVTQLTVRAREAEAAARAHEEAKARAEKERDAATEREARTSSAALERFELERRAREAAQSQLAEASARAEQKAREAEQLGCALREKEAALATADGLLNEARALVDGKTSCFHRLFLVSKTAL
jgi:CCR4-NOT transcriptional regulation complex NOT5 subunit